MGFRDLAVLAAGGGAACFRLHVLESRSFESLIDLKWRASVWFGSGSTLRPEAAQIRGLGSVHSLEQVNGRAPAECLSQRPECGLGGGGIGSAQIQTKLIRVCEDGGLRGRRLSAPPAASPAGPGRRRRAGRPSPTDSVVAAAAAADSAGRAAAGRCACRWSRSSSALPARISLLRGSLLGATVDWTGVEPCGSPRRSTVTVTGAR